MYGIFFFDLVLFCFCVARDPSDVDVLDVL